MSRFRPFLCALALGALVACDQASAPGAADPNQLFSGASAPEGAAPGTCWGKVTTPAIIETVTEQVLVQPAEVDGAGAVLQPAIYKTETRQEIVRERADTWFETPCADVMTPDFIASVQRALRARGLYRGPVMGEIDPRTRAAISRYQEESNLPSGLLSLESARKLGLIRVEFEAE